MLNIKTRWICYEKEYYSYIDISAGIFAFYQWVGNNRNELSELGTSVQNIKLK